MAEYAWSVREITAHLDKYGMGIVLKDGKPALLPNGAPTWAVKQLTPHLKTRREEIITALSVADEKRDIRKAAVDAFRARAKSKPAYALVGPLPCRLWAKSAGYAFLTTETITELAAGIVPDFVQFVCVEGDKEWTKLPTSA